MPATALICTRCGTLAASAAAACPRCSAPLAERPGGPPAAARCPACGTTAALTGRGACPGCGLPLLGSGRPVRAVAARRPARPLVVAAAVLGSVALLALAAGVRGGGEPGLTTRWRLETGAAVVGAPAVDGRTVVALTAAGVLVAADVDDGDPHWRFETEEPPGAAPSVGNGLAFVVTRRAGGGGHVFAVDLRTGEEQWRFVSEVPVLGPPAVDGATVYVSAGDVVALDAVTGDERWRRQVGGGAGEVVAAGGLAVVVTADGLAGLEGATGDRRWAWPLGHRPEVAPAVAGDVVLTGTAAGAVAAVEARSGRERWRSGIGGLLLQPPVVTGSLAVVATVDGALAVDVESGDRRWRAGPTADDRLRVASDGDAVGLTAADAFLLDGRTGDVVGRQPLPDDRREPEGPGAGSRSGGPPAPAMAGGALLVTGGGVITALTPDRP